MSHDTTKTMPSVEEYVDRCMKDIHVQEWKVDHGVLQQCLYVPLQNMLKNHYRTQELKRKLQVLKDQKREQIQQQQQQQQPQQQQQKEYEQKLEQKEGQVVDHQDNNKGGQVSHPQVKPAGDDVGKEIVENANQQVEPISSISKLEDAERTNQLKEKDVIMDQSMDESRPNLQEAQVEGESHTSPKEELTVDGNRQHPTDQVTEVEDESPPSMDEKVELPPEQDESDQGDNVVSREDGDAEMDQEGEEDGDDDDDVGDDDGDEEEGDESEEEVDGEEEEEQYNLQQQEEIEDGEEKEIGRSTTENAQQEEEAGNEMVDGEIHDAAPSKSTKDAKNVSNVNRKRPNANPPNAPDSSSKRPRQHAKQHVNASKVQNKNQSQIQSQSGVNKPKQTVAGIGVNRKRTGLRNRRGGRGRGRPK
jgi:hypothetical protein